MVTLNELLGCSPVSQKNRSKLKNKLDFNYKKLANGNLLLSEYSKSISPASIASISSELFQQEYECIISRLGIPEYSLASFVPSFAIPEHSLASIADISSELFQQEYECIISRLGIPEYSLASSVPSFAIPEHSLASIADISSELFQQEYECIISRLGIPEHSLASFVPSFAIPEHSLASIADISNELFQYEDAFSSFAITPASLASYPSPCLHNALLSATERSFAIDAISAVDAYKNIGISTNHISREFAYSSAVGSLNSYIDEISSKLNLSDDIFHFYGLHPDFQSIKDSFAYLENNPPQENKKHLKKKETKDIWNKEFSLQKYNKVNRKQKKLEKLKDKIKSLEKEVNKLRQKKTPEKDTKNKTGRNYVIGSFIRQHLVEFQSEKGKKALRKAPALIAMDILNFYTGKKYCNVVDRDRGKANMVILYNADFDSISWRSWVQAVGRAIIKMTQ